MKRDDVLVGMIKQAMLHDGRLSLQPIAVIARGGRVTLRGLVQTFSRKRAAGEIASAIKGVREVVNELEVVSPGLLSDEEVAENVRKALEAHPDVTKEAITVSVDMGVVKLHGNVGSRWERLVAEDTAIGAPGVLGIHNFLFVDPVERVEDASLGREIMTAINLTPGLHDTQVRAAISTGRVVLSGRVSSVWQKRRAETVARLFRLVAISNEIKVRPAPPRASQRI